MPERPKAPGADHAKIQEMSMGNRQGTLPVTDIEIGWLAGIIDGEGTIAFSPFYRQLIGGGVANDLRVKPQLIVTNTDKALIERVADILGRCHVGVHVQTRTQRGQNFLATSKYQPLHTATSVGFRRVKKALEVIGPHLVSKKRKADLVLRYIVQRELRLSSNSRAPLDMADYRLIHEILVYSRAVNAKGQKSRHFGWIEGLLNEHEQKDGAYVPSKMCSGLTRERESPAEMTGPPD
jgi:hypothetical protein